MPVPIAAAMDDARVAQRLEDVRSRIAAAARRAGRASGDIALIGVSKTQDAAAIETLIDAGLASFGENKVQEAKAKWPALYDRHPGLRLHMIGQLQSNKAEEAVALFHAIHTVDRLSLARALGAAMQRTGRRPDCFVQVNVGEEPQKGGCPIADLPALLGVCAEHHLPIVGLMCIPPFGLEPAPYFALLAKLARRHDLPRLSMGMSGDFETAIMLGATDVRVGTALFGDRH